MTQSISRFFAENGYYHAKGVFSKAEMRPLARDFDRIVNQVLANERKVNPGWKGGPTRKLKGGKSTELVHTHQVQIYSEKWLQAFYQKRFLQIASSILGPDIMLHHSKLFEKPPEKGAPFPIHQDWSYFPTIKDTMMAGIIHVSKATDKMGCLRVYPGSHKLGRKKKTSGRDVSRLLEKYPLEDATIVECEPGDVVFFHYFTLHGSMPNYSKQHRKTVLVQMHAGDDHVVKTNGHPNAQLVLRGWNHCATRKKAEQFYKG
jgi:ectoine hydroxylase-related dioxygenase (phytanoyl-CoA dioxygenase family)